MSLCYDFQKWTIILLVAFTISLSVGLVYSHVVYGESDFMLEVSNASSNNDELTLFAIEGESYKQLCPSGQCNLNGKIDPSFAPPTPDSPSMYFDYDFILRDKIPNPNVGPNEQAYLERFSLSNSCYVDDIIEDNGQEIYVCHDVTTRVTRTFDSRSWDYDTNLIFDAKKNTLKVYGNYTGNYTGSR
jgi:hypothetical protein